MKTSEVVLFIPNSLKTIISVLLNKLNAYELMGIFLMGMCSHDKGLGVALNIQAVDLGCFCA
jgi:hypothetical protein